MSLYENDIEKEIYINKAKEMLALRKKWDDFIKTKETPELLNHEGEG